MLATVSLFLHQQVRGSRFSLRLLPVQLTIGSGNDSLLHRNSYHWYKSCVIKQNWYKSCVIKQKSLAAI